MTDMPPYVMLDPRVQRTLGLLFTAFTDLLTEKHYRYIKVQEITKAAKLNRATFYHHFQNLDEFIIFCAREGFRRDLVSQFTLATFEYNVANFKILVKWVLEFISTNFAQWHYQWDEILFEKAVRIEFYYFLTTWITYPAKKMSKTAFGDTCALILSSSIVGLGMVWCHNGLIESIDELSDRITEVFRTGFPGLGEHTVAA